MNKKHIIDAQTGVEEIVDMTPEEETQLAIDTENANAERQAKQQAKAQKEADALAGNNKLLELGLTQAQVTVMTGYTPPVSE